MNEVGSTAALAPQDEVIAPPNRTRLITLAIALTMFTGPLSLVLWVPLNVLARRGGNRVLARWSAVMSVLMIGILLALSVHAVFGTHLTTVIG